MECLKIRWIFINNLNRKVWGFYLCEWNFRFMHRYIDFYVVQQAMFERIKAEKEEGRGLDTSESQSTEAAARTSGKKVTEKMDEDAVKQRLTKLTERLSKLNAYSSRLNLLTLMSLTWHFVYLGHRLSLTCWGIEPPLR